MINRAFDIGFGNTKISLGHIGPHGEPAKTMIFPSMAVPASPKTLSNKVLGRRDTIVVEVDGMNYEVGPDVLSAAPGKYARILDDNYFSSKAYKALIKGALYYTGQNVIDILVVGLPVQQFYTHRTTVAALFKGKHVIPNPHAKSHPAAPETMHVEVKQVRVFPQPLGALLEYAVPRGFFTRVKNEVNLVIDPGMGTFDWFVSTGTVPIEARCGSFRNSVGAIVQAVANSLDPSLSENIRILQRIDDALRNKQPTVKFDGKECDLRKHIQIAENMAREAVSAMLSSVGNTQDIDNIILAGGGAIYFKEAAEQMLGRSIIISANPVVSNVLGFQLAAEQIASELQQRAR